MSCKSILGIAAIACVPAVAFAGAGFILNDETTLHLTGVGQIRYDDNILLRDTNTQSDTIFSVIPGAEIDYNGGQTKGTLTAAEDFELYSSHSDLNANLFTGVGEINYDSGLTKVDSRVGYREMDQGSVTARNADQSVRHDLFDASVNGIWSTTAKTSIGLGLFYDETNYAGVGYADNRHFGVPVDLYYAYSPKVDLSVGYRFRDTEVQRLPSASRNFNSKDHFFNIGARGEFAPKLKGQFRVGYGIRDFDSSGSEDQLGLSGTMTYVYSPKTSFDATISNDFNNSALGTSQETLAVRTSGKFEFSPQWSAQLGLSYESTSYKLSSRQDDFFVGDATVMYAIDESISLQGTYVFRNNSSSAAPFTGNILSLGLSLRY